MKISIVLQCFNIVCAYGHVPMHLFSMPVSLFLAKKKCVCIYIYVCICQGPAPVDPGNSKGGRRWRGKTCLFIDIRLD